MTEVSAAPSFMQVALAQAKSAAADGRSVLATYQSILSGALL